MVAESCAISEELLARTASSQLAFGFEEILGVCVYLVKLGLETPHAMPAQWRLV